MVLIFHFEKVLSDQSEILEFETGNPKRAQSALFTNASSAAPGDVQISFAGRSLWKTIGSGQSLELSAQPGTQIDFSEEEVRIRGSVSGVKLEALFIA
jgi:hypothetical protein